MDEKAAQKTTKKSKSADKLASSTTEFEHKAATIRMLNSWLKETLPGNVNLQVEKCEIGFAVNAVIATLGDHVVVGNPCLVGGVAGPGDRDFAEVQPVDQVHGSVVGHAVHAHRYLARPLAVDIEVPTAALALHARQDGHH